MGLNELYFFSLNLFTKLVYVKIKIMELIYDSEGGKIEWLSNGKVLVKTIKSFIRDQELRDFFNAGYEQVKKQNGKKWLSNNANLIVYKADDIDWINEDWLPRMLKAGWKYWAVIEPTKATGNVSMMSFLEFYKKQGITLKIFHTMEDAVAWIRPLA